VPHEYDVLMPFCDVLPLSWTWVFLHLGGLVRLSPIYAKLARSLSSLDHHASLTAIATQPTATAICLR
jgi:hypothetical protein